jgi:hypothetical protein
VFIRECEFGNTDMEVTSTVDGGMYQAFAHFD